MANNGGPMVDGFWAKYKSGFKGDVEKRTFAKTAPFVFKPGLDSQRLAALGMGTGGYPTPRNPHKSRG